MLTPGNGLHLPGKGWRFIKIRNQPWAQAEWFVYKEGGNGSLWMTMVIVCELFRCLKSTPTNEVAGKVLSISKTPLWIYWQNHRTWVPLESGLRSAEYRGWLGGDWNTWNHQIQSHSFGSHYDTAPTLFNSCWECIQRRVPLLLRTRGS